jgi:hypothetical protein
VIHSIEVTGLRALHDVEVRLAPFQVLVGPNASGKSTLFDALLLVRDILGSGLDASVFGDIRVGISQRAAHPRDLTWMREGIGFQIIVTLELPQALVERLGGHYGFSRYEVSVSTNGPLAFDSEELWLCANAAVMDPKSGLTTFGRNAARAAFGYRRPALGQLRKGLPGDRKVVAKVVDSGNDYFRAETSKWNSLFRLGPTKSALANLPEDEDKFPAATWTKRQLMEGVHRLALNAEAMRLPAPVGSARDFLPDGSNLPWVVHALEQQDPARKQAWVEHLATSLDDLTDVETRERPEDRARYLELT